MYVTVYSRVRQKCQGFGLQGTSQLISLEESTGQSQEVDEQGNSNWYLTFPVDTHHRQLSEGHASKETGKRYVLVVHNGY